MATACHQRRLPQLPADYLDAIDRLKPTTPARRGHLVPTAATTGNMVITPDFLTDDKWSELRHLPLALGFVAAWSMPIKSASGRVLEHLWHLLPRTPQPNPAEIEGIEALAGAAALTGSA